jgi:hypothetical protein
MLSISVVPAPRSVKTAKTGDVIHVFDDTSMLVPAGRRSAERERQKLINMGAGGFEDSAGELIKGRQEGTIG